MLYWVGEIRRYGDLIVMKKIWKLIVLFIYCFSLSSISLGSEVSDAFNVIIGTESIQVISPSKKESKTSVIIENKSFSKFYFKIINNRDQTLYYLSVAPKGNAARDLNFKTNNKIFLIPISPPLQRVELKFSKEAYHIPYQSE